MTEEKNLIDLFKSKGALLEGHFVLSSGLHSNRYFQSALLLQDPETAAQLGQAIADKFPGEIDAVVSPAIGGLIIGHEVARAKKSRAIFVEKDDTGKPVLRRSFSIGPKEKVLVIEDVITTGLSTGEVLRLVKETGADIKGVGSVVNRSPSAALGASGGVLSSWNVPVESLLILDVQTWKPEECPLCKDGVPAVKPGSRKK